jgi:hypothetical protein
MAYQWGDRPLGARPSRAVDAAALLAAVLVLAVACLAGAGRVQRNLDRGCVHGLSTPCALDGRR